MSKRRTLIAASLLAVGLLPLGGRVLAQQEEASGQTTTGHPAFVAELSAFEETDGAASAARGVAGVLSKFDGSSMYYSITLTDASSQVTAAHLHLAPRGVAGPVIVPLCTPQTHPCQTEGLVVQGTFAESDLTGPLKAATFETLLENIRNGQVYVNVHTTKYPGGEARGQLADVMSLLGPVPEVTPTPEPEAAST